MFQFVVFLHCCQRLSLGKAGHLAAVGVQTAKMFILCYNCQVAQNRPVFTKRVLWAVIILFNFYNINKLFD